MTLDVAGRYDRPELFHFRVARGMRAATGRQGEAVPGGSAQPT